MAQRLLALEQLYHDQRRFADSEDTYQQALVIAQESLGDFDAHTHAILASLGSLYLDIGRFGDAEPLLLDAYQGHRRTYGRELWRPRRVADHLADLYENLGNPAAAAQGRETESDERPKGPLEH